jgi:hypothetical protein
MIDLPTFPEHPSRVWDYLVDMPYMPSARDRELLLKRTKGTEQEHRVRIWDYFFRPRPGDTGKSVLREIQELRVRADTTDAETSERLITARKRLAGFEEGWRTESAAVNAELQRIEAETGNSERRRATKSIVIGEIIGCSAVVVLTAQVLFDLLSVGVAAKSGTFGCGLLGLLVIMLPVILISDLVVRAARQRRTSERIQARIAAEQQHVRDRWSPRDESLRRDIFADRARIAADEEIIQRLIPHLRLRITSLEVLFDDLLRQIPTPPTEAEVEAWLAADLRMLRQKGEERHAMEGRSVRFSGDKDVFVIQAPAEIQDPSTIPAAYRDHADRDKHLRARRIRQTAADDRVEHHGVFSYDVIFIGEAVLARYSILFDFIEGERIRESAPRQHYADFVMVEMRHEFREIREPRSGEQVPVMLPSMILALSNGDRVTITVTTSAYFEAVDAGAAANSEAYEVANDALKAITEKVYNAKRKLEIGNR